MAANVQSQSPSKVATTSGSSSLAPQHGNNFDGMDKSTSSTLKRNPKMELSKTDLLKLLSYLEGELQARDVTIATLKAEKVKTMLMQAKYGRLNLRDPYSALQRDSYATPDIRMDEAAMNLQVENQMASLENLIRQQRLAQQRMMVLLKEGEKRHSRVVKELEEEKRKHEHDTAQGDDITYGLEKERTRLRQELEIERQGKKKLEKDLKKLTETLEEEQGRQKQIVLLLLAERKKIISKYIEERKRSEDLAQILTEEKGRIDSMAEGLEEESKKSLQMEAELEKHLADFDSERQQMKGQLAKQEARNKELEVEISKRQEEVNSLKNQMSEAHQVAMFQANTLSGGMNPSRMVLPRGVSSTPPQPPSKPPNLTAQTIPRTGASATGVARLVGPGSGLRSVVYTTSDVQRAVNTKSFSVAGDHQTWSGSNLTDPQASTEKSVARIAPTVERSQPQMVQVTPRVSVSASPGTKVFTTTQGGKVTFHVTTNASSGQITSTTTTTTTTTTTPVQGPPLVPKKPLPLGRGVPPPVPPNKPALPPKKEMVTRTVVQSGRPEDSNQPISFEVKPQKVGTQGVKFGITISKDKIQITNPQQGGSSSSNDLSASQNSVNSSILGQGAAGDGPQALRRDPQVQRFPPTWRLLR